MELNSLNKMKPLYKVYKIEENEIKQLKHSLIDKEYFFSNIKFHMCDNDKNSEEPAFSVYSIDDPDTAGILRDSQGLLFVFINKEVGKNLDKILGIE